MRWSLSVWYALNVGRTIMRKRRASPFLIIGTVLLAAALSLYIHNRLDSCRAGREADSVLGSVQTQILAHTPLPTEHDPQAGNSPPPTPIPEMPVVTVDGNDYIGYLSVPSLGLELPIMSDWDYDKLQLAPCRQLGSVYTDDLVIAAHNYDTHFGKLRELSEGETVLFTDMEGIVSTYCVEKLETLSPDAVDTVLNSGYDLVLYTCTKGGRTRVIVFCDRAAETASSSAPRQTEK